MEVLKLGSGADDGKMLKSRDRLIGEKLYIESERVNYSKRF